jgi:hypothetical protein
MENPPLSWHHHPADVDKQKEMAELAVAGLILPQVPDRNDDDFHRGGLKGGTGKKFDEMRIRKGSLSLVPVICFVAGLHMRIKRFRENKDNIKNTEEEKETKQSTPTRLAPCDSNSDMLTNSLLLGVGLAL